MKLFISVDIEGVTGSTSWSETEKSNGDYGFFAQQMTDEVNAVCKGALRMGFREILVKDAHETGRNIVFNELPKEVKIVRAWSGHPFSMVQGLDESFDAAIFVGYHSPSGSNKNPLAHTMTASGINYLKINGEYASEFLLHGYAASLMGVPVVMVTGDKGLCDDIKGINEDITTVAVKEGIGNSTISIHPELAVEIIKDEAEKALKGDVKSCILELPKDFEVEISYKEHASAYKSSFYPGAEQLSAHVIRYKSDNYFDVLRMINFLV